MLIFFFVAGDWLTHSADQTVPTLLSYLGANRVGVALPYWWWSGLLIVPLLILIGGLWRVAASRPLSGLA